MTRILLKVAKGILKIILKSILSFVAIIIGGILLLLFLLYFIDNGGFTELLTNFHFGY